MSIELLLITVFVLAYAAITLEHPINVNKAVPALAGAVLMWALLTLHVDSLPTWQQNLQTSALVSAKIVGFLWAAMTVVEWIDGQGGFAAITRRIHTQHLSSLLVLTGFVTFFLSAVLDNLTTAIVMVSLMKKLLDKREDRWFFAGIIVIAANAGGAWSPIGDVTTTMLWIGGQVTAWGIVQTLFLPSLVCLLLPMGLAAYQLRGHVVQAPDGVLHHSAHKPVGLTAWRQAFARVDKPTLVFFAGILMAVAVLEHAHILQDLATWLNRTVGRLDLIVLLMGLASALVDNVPLVAASMGMYSLAEHPTDSFLWEFIAYCAGTGGSVLIIGSAAGVAAMGLEKIDFFWYVKRISGLALLGYVAGAFTYIVQFNLTH